MDCSDFMTSLTTARDAALLGQYDKAGIYYSSCINAIPRLLQAGDSETANGWLQARDTLNKELADCRDMENLLQEMRNLPMEPSSTSHNNIPVSYLGVKEPDYNLSEYKDPDVWPDPQLEPRMTSIGQSRRRPPSLASNPPRKNQERRSTQPAVGKKGVG